MRDRCARAARQRGGSRRPQNRWGQGPSGRGWSDRIANNRHVRGAR
jgi:hypothetical protein